MLYKLFIPLKIIDIVSLRSLTLSRHNKEKWDKGILSRAFFLRSTLINSI